MRIDGLDQTDIFQRRHLLHLLLHVLNTRKQKCRRSGDRDHDHRVHDAIMVGPTRQIRHVGGLAPFVLRGGRIDEESAQVPFPQKFPDPLVPGLEFLG